MVIWLIGLSGAGKTTIGSEVHRQWKAKSPDTVIVDGDEIRALFKRDKGIDPYTVEGRRANAETIIELCAWLDRQGMNVVCNILCIFEDILAENRDRFSSYFEVFVDAPFELVASRDVKGIYAPALNGEAKHVVGVDIEFPRPKTPDYVVNNTMDGDVAPIAAAILERALSGAKE